MPGDESSVVGVFDKGRLAAMVLVVGEAAHHHAARDRIQRVRADDAPRILDETVDLFGQARLARVRVDIEDEDLAGVDPACPEMPPVVGQSGVVRLVSAADGQAVDDLAVGVGAGSHVDGDQLVRLVAHALDPQGPDIDELFLAGDLGHVGRHAGFVGQGGIRRHRA